MCRGIVIINMAFKISSKTIGSTAKGEKEEPNVMYFESDEEFTDFCAAPFAVIKTSEKGTMYYYEGEYSDEYKKCLKEGKTFIIKDENSQVFKRKCVTKRVPIAGVRTRKDVAIQLAVENLEEYFGED